MTKHEGIVVWLTGLSGAGKSTVARHAKELLNGHDVSTLILDGDDVRQRQNSHLGFSKEDRDRNVRSIGALARESAKRGTVVLVAVIAPYRETRAEVRRLCERYLEVFVDAPLVVCESRDPKGLYSRARKGEIRHFTGLDSPYEPPSYADVHCRTAYEDPQESACLVVEAVLKELGLSGTTKNT